MAINGDSATNRASGIVARMRGAPRYLAIPIGVAFILGGTILSPLPIFGLWMVPVGLAILAPHSPYAQRLWRRLQWRWLKFLRWSIRHGFVRVKQPRDLERARKSSDPGRSIGKEIDGR
jgi:hypothetical protein